MNEDWNTLWGLEPILKYNVDKQKKIKQLNYLRAGVEKIRSLVSFSWPKWWPKSGISKEETAEFLILAVKNLSRISGERQKRKEGKQKGEEEEKQEAWREEQGMAGSKVGKA